MCENLDTICGSPEKKRSERRKERSYFQLIKVLVGVERYG